MDIQTQLDLEQIFHKNQVMRRLRNEFTTPIMMQILEETQTPVDFGIDLLCHMELQRRATVGTMVGLLKRHFEDAQYPLQATADALSKAADDDLVDWDGIAKEFVIRIPVDASVRDELARFQYPMPMVVPPKEITNNRETGYLGASAKGSVILQTGNHHEDDVCLDHLNRSNRVALSINPDTARMVSNQWKDLDRQREGESWQDYQDRLAAFEKYDENARDVMEHMYVAGNRFHMTHKYDKRGRTYAQGYHVNPQGTDWNKAVIEFADKELVTA